LRYFALQIGDICEAPPESLTWSATPRNWTLAEAGITPPMSAADTVNDEGHEDQTEIWQGGHAG